MMWGGLRMLQTARKGGHGAKEVGNYGSGHFLAASFFLLALVGGLGLATAFLVAGSFPLDPLLFAFVPFFGPSPAALRFAAKSLFFLSKARRLFLSFRALILSLVFFRRVLPTSSKGPNQVAGFPAFNDSFFIRSSILLGKSSGRSFRPLWKGVFMPGTASDLSANAASSLNGHKKSETRLKCSPPSTNTFTMSSKHRMSKSPRCFSITMLLFRAKRLRLTLPKPRSWIN
mmetsp:Transcript_15441/g.27365  ORF Transcript_15441/g.27365 Transcript_15441/m.27365 type:complete len:230 (+) Transcript_15441:596-1285(+)